MDILKGGDNNCRAFKTISIVFIILFLGIGCNNSDNHSNASSSEDTSGVLNQESQVESDTNVVKGKYDDKITDLIFALPEVKERVKYIENETKGERHLQLMISETPEKSGSNYYVVKAVEDNGINFVTHFNFYVYPRSEGNFEIKYYDTENDTIISLESWRKQIKDSF